MNQKILFTGLFLTSVITIVFVLRYQIALGILSFAAFMAGFSLAALMRKNKKICEAIALIGCLLAIFFSIRYGFHGIFLFTVLNIGFIFALAMLSAGFFISLIWGEEKAQKITMPIGIILGDLQQWLYDIGFFGGPGIG